MKTSVKQILLCSYVSYNGKKPNFLTIFDGSILFSYMKSSVPPEAANQFHICHCVKMSFILL